MSEENYNIPEANLSQQPQQATQQPQPQQVVQQQMQQQPFQALSPGQNFEMLKQQINNSYVPFENHLQNQMNQSIANFQYKQQQQYQQPQFPPLQQQMQNEQQMQLEQQQKLRGELKLIIKEVLTEMAREVENEIQQCDADEGLLLKEIQELNDKLDAKIMNLETHRSSNGGLTPNKIATLALINKLYRRGYPGLYTPLPSPGVMNNQRFY